MTGQTRYNELEMLPNNVVMAQSEVLSCHLPGMTMGKQKTSVQMPSLGAEI
jgi:hypothetical protein